MEPRLKSLELMGYKTFASRTSFEFPGMVTAIVGPNGSGKSNIADSLRWVLGEQSYSLLRGKKTEDMIFAGSEQRTRAGMASATITFDNGDGWLPIDYSEVSITRRAYRDGQNEYLLNGQRVRLKEISELLAQSGLAERTYTIIGQGLIDTALALKPEERRRLFEEAAGIGLYRSRKEEALNRLETTRRNLERVKDILAELEPRLQSLEKQARRAQEYERIKADLRLLLQDWYGYHWHHHQEEFNHVHDILKAQESRLELARQKHAEVNQEMNMVRGQVQVLRGQLNDWHTQSSRLHSDLGQVSRQIAILDERQRSLNEQKINWQSEITRSEEETQAYQSDLDLAVSELAHADSELQDARAQMNLSREKLMARQQERDQVEKLLWGARQNLTGRETRQVTLKAHQNELANRRETLLKNKETVRATVESLQKEMDKLQAQLKKLELDRDAADRERKEKDDELQSFRKLLAEHEVDRRHFLDLKASDETETARLRAQLEVLEGAERSLSGHSEGARFLIQALRQGQLKGNFLLMSSLLEVPAEYETAIAAALGDLLDILLLDSATDLEKTLEFIDRDAKGRVGLLKPEGSIPDEQPAFPDHPDCFGPAIDLVTIKAEQEYEPALKLILGRLLIVKDRQTAFQMLRELPPGTQLVTLKGELFQANGPVFAGKASGTGMISRSRQIRELNETVNFLKERLQANQVAVNQVEQDIKSLRQKETDYVRQSREWIAKADKARDSYLQGKNSYEQARRQSEWYKNQQNDLDGQIAAAEKEIKKDEAEMSAISTALAGERDQISKLQRELNQLPIDEFQTQAVHWETVSAVASRALEESQKRVKERERRLEETKKRLAVVLFRLDELGKGKAEIDHQKIELHASENALNSEIQSIQDLIEPAENELSLAERQYVELQAIEATSQQNLTLAERHYTQAELDMARNRDGLQALHRRIEEDFGLVAFEYAANISGQTPLPFDGMVNQLPVIAELSPEIEEAITRYKTQMRRMGAINPDALNEFHSVQERFQFLTSQVTDLNKADASLRQVIAELDDLMKRDFRKTFTAVAGEFRTMFTRLFGGGSAHLVLIDEENPIETGIDIEARLPGRREQGLSLLSGGERSLTAAALVFALLKVSPTPFCVMDEVDAMLDESNVGRFCDMLRELSQSTQFILITHNRNTVQTADVVYGITMGRDSTSQMISVKLDEVNEDLVI